MAKYVKYILICLLFVFVMSHNTSALSFGATDTRNYRANDSSDSAIFLTNNEGTSYTLYHDSNNLVYVMSSGALNLAIPTNTSVVNGVRLKFNAATPSKYIMNVAYRFCPANPDNLKSWIGFSANAYNALLSQDWIVNGNCINGSISVFGAQARYQIELGSVNGGLQIGSIAAGGSIVFNKPTFIVLSDDADYSSVLNAIKNNTDDIKDKLDEIADSADAALDREQSETQDAADDSSTAGASSSSDATTATASLISVIGGFVNVITNAQATNCKINMNTTQLQVGEIDLCANPVPSYIQIIGSLILICAVIPLAIILFNRFIGLFRSFQG